MYACTYVYMCLRMYLHAHMDVYMYLCVSVCMCMTTSHGSRELCRLKGRRGHVGLEVPVDGFNEQVESDDPLIKSQLIKSQRGAGGQQSRGRTCRTDLLFGCEKCRRSFDRQQDLTLHTSHKCGTQYSADDSQFPSDKAA